jgi:Rrf2 family cysteine metabolism transcriptional repressor
MLRLTKREDYAILILTYLSTRQGLSTSASQVSDHHKISAPFAAVILKDLTKAGILKSERGPNGGYLLIGSPAELTVFNVLEGISGSYALTTCVLDEEACEVAETCSIQTPIRILNTQITDTLKNLSIANLQEMATL